MNLSIPRKSLFPLNGDSWQSIAQREFANTPVDDAISQLQSWNLHVFMRSKAPPGTPQENNPIMPCDVIFLEPPLAS